ncbi:hypothetical protein H072_5149 [Dactylellina haptotyla CBS 200.50]|uniref:PPM-type phosphatase domain-containing protein n=1 Tax=Dactylellina haptotyla (strain CBS 200.50) TaxID=1284197 RepID=S8C080_DACHA|nr:hypothetical protein H072_5149 [Dactylellina haptotyla CBS 200.50]
MPAATRQKLQTQTSTGRVGIDTDRSNVLEPAVEPEPGSEREACGHISTAEATYILNKDALEVSPIPQLESSRISRLQVASLPAHEENEDAFAYDFLPDAHSILDHGSEQCWSFLAVCDGHYGYRTSRYLKDVLIKQVYRALLALYESHQASSPPAEDLVKSTISTAFTALDESILSNSSAPAIATQGSCALLSFYDARHNRLFTACTGDSRCVYGKRIGSPQNTRWLSKSLSTDQNFASNPDEVKRVTADHPGEKDVILQNRLMGDLAVSRAFGNKRFKLHEDGGAKRLRSGTQYDVIKSPPYITAEPEVTAYTAPKEGDFVVLATDGLWDFLSSEDAVALVGRWMDDHIEKKEQRKTRLTHSQEEMFVFEDDGNVGVHLIRNALGGVREGRLLFTLSLPPGKNAAKKHRDDITVVVAFF